MQQAPESGLGHPPSMHAPSVEELYEVHGLALYRYARLLCGSPQDAEDLVQAAFVALMETGLPNPNQTRAFLFRSVHDQAVNLLRRRDTWREKVSPGLARYMTARREPGQEPLGEAEVEKVNAALSALNLEQREVLGLRYFEGLTFEEIATLLNLPLGTVASRCRLALEHLRKAVSLRGPH